MEFRSLEGGYLIVCLINPKRSLDIPCFSRRQILSRACLLRSAFPRLLPLLNAVSVLLMPLALCLMSGGILKHLKVVESKCGSDLEVSFIALIALILRGLA